MAEPELTYERAFPGRFLKAALFEGKTVTLTIESAFLEVLEGEKGKENKLILAFVGKTMQLVCNKTNALCIKEMFGNKIKDWVGKRVAFYPTKAAFGPKKVDAIRVFGSPDITEDMEVAARVGRKNFKATMQAITVTTPNANPAPLTRSKFADSIEEKFTLLGWSTAKIDAFIEANPSADGEELDALLVAELDRGVAEFQGMEVAQHKER